MTKKVAHGSIERGVREAFRTLGITKVLAAIERYTGQRKSESLLRKYSDPDDPKHHIPLRDSVAIDAAFVSEGLPPPFHRIHAQLLELSASDQASDPQLSIGHLTLSIGAAYGLVAESVLLAETLRIRGGAKKGGNSKAADHDDILKHLQQLDDATSVLRKAIANFAKRQDDTAQPRVNGAAMQKDISQPGADGAAMR